MMKKIRWLGLAVTVAFAIIMAGCGKSQTEAVGQVKAPEATGRTESLQIIVEKQEYQMLKGVKDSEGFTKYIIRVFDDAKGIVFERDFRLTREAISIDMLDNDIVIYKIGIGTGLNYTHYYDRKNRRESPVYTTPLLVGNGKVVVPKQGKLIVSDMFDHKIFYKELIIEDFPPVANPVDAFRKIEWAGSDKLSVTYAVGKRGERFTERTVVYDLN